MTTRLRAYAAAGLLLAGAAVVLPLTAGPAAAGTCSTSTPAPNCTTSGSFALTAGSLGVEAPASLSWSATMNGLNLTAVDATHTTYTPVDPTGSGAGWNVTAAATQFTTGSVTLANSGTFSTTGSTTSATATTAPTAACATGSTCVLPTNTLVTYPVAITTAASSPTPVVVYAANTSTGEGAISLGSTGNPVGWWISVPATAVGGTYTSTITLAINSTP